VILTSYGVTRSDQELLSKKRWCAVIIDEAQNIKNVDAAQTRAVKKLKSNIRIAMSGTPVENRLSEYWSIFDFIYKGYMGNLKKFTKEYAYPIEVNRNKKRLDRFLKITAPFILRRLKTDKSIISDLPEKIENDYMATLVKEQGALYQGVLNTVMTDIEGIDPEGEEAGIRRRGMVLKMIMALKQVCNHPSQYLKKSDASPDLSGKAGMLLDMLDNILENNEKVLIFTQFREMGLILQQMIRDRFGTDSMFLHGGISRKKRDEMVERFQNDAREKIFLLSIKAGGTGLNLTAASHVIHYDLWWNPAVEVQATDRAYRIGQNKNVMVYRLITQGTFEEKINAMLKDKKALADLAVSTGEKWVGELSNRDLKALFSIQ
jgi:SNF2 family DNA or RNA helicase